LRLSALSAPAAILPKPARLPPADAVGPLLAWRLASRVAWGTPRSLGLASSADPVGTGSARGGIVSPGSASWRNSYWANARRGNSCRAGWRSKTRMVYRRARRDPDGGEWGAWRDSW